MNGVLDQEICIRPMAESDIEAVMAIAAGLPDAPRWEVSAYEGTVARALVRRGIALVAQDRGSDLVGFVVGGLVPPEAEIESIGVRPKNQRQGIARKLLAAFEAEARRLGCAVILLEVRPSNGPARAFYGACGFAETGRRPAYYANPVEDAVLMARSLQ